MSKTTIKKIDLSQIRYTPVEGEIIQDLSSGKYMIYHNDSWVALKANKSGIEMNLYDMNKQIIEQLPVLEDLSDKIELIDKFYSNSNNYYLMYGKEISYFTLFHINTNINFGTTVIDCLKNVGNIKAIDLTEDKNAIEIWVTITNSDQQEQATCLYLFPYDEGIVEI